ncbi:MAG: response regulator [Clostridia bacterium]|nr:response regulator [Clostridia bacterium]
MYRVIVVDDELVIRKGVSSMINAEIEDFTCVECFKDGIEVIEYLQNHDADVIVSDIRMINVSGIELAKYVYENKSYIKVVLLSGYSDFEYAKAAVKYRVTDYILKPTDFDELKSVFDGIRKEFSNDSAMKERRTFNERIQKLYSYIKENDANSAHEMIDILFTEIPRNIDIYICDLYEALYERLSNHSKIVLKPFSSKELLHQDTDEIKNIAHSLFDELFAFFNGEDDELSEKIKKYIDEHFCDDISLQSVADAVALSPVYLSRFFKKNVGANFSDYILSLRMEKAGELLLKNKKVNDVSFACGFNNPGYFSKVFKNYYNCTPKEFVRKSRK